MITRVTITGPDDSIQPGELLQLSRQYPFVEWGILVSASNSGIARFPSMEWIEDLSIVKMGNPELKLSMHVCGRYVREFAQGSITRLTQDFHKVLPDYERMQINFHNIPHNASADMFSSLSRFPGKQFIFQYDDVNKKHVEIAVEEGINASALFDRSGGNGILPDTWPELLPNIPCGYAGGLGPENLEEQIIKIESIVGDTPIWIDMETRVRSNGDQLFDLDKVRTCLEISSKCVTSGTKSE